MIFTERQITVRNGKSTINEPVILYRGDYEVSIKFTIMESKFRFKSGVNLVDSEKASHGQLAILAPYGGNVFSEVVKCEDGTVTFTLTKEMIDQLEEVGLYSFQIRLFDYYRESRVSIPPVEFGIEVREPVASEDHDNTVNNAIVGYSIAKVVDPSKGNVGPTFDDRGNYNKTDWETGDRITEGKLNKIEDALDKINQNEKNDVAALDKRVTNNYNVLESNKLNVSDKIKSSQLDTSANAYKIQLNNLSDEVHQAMAGTANVNPVIPNKSITSEKYANDSVTGDSLNITALREVMNYVLAFTECDLSKYDDFANQRIIVRDNNGKVISINAVEKTTIISPGNFIIYKLLCSEVDVHTPFSIKIPIFGMGENSRIVTREIANGQTKGDTQVSIYNGYGVMTNLSYSQDSETVELLIDNRTGSTDLIVGIPQFFRDVIPIHSDSDVIIQDVNNAITFNNHVIGGSGKLTPYEMNLVKASNCYEIAYRETYVTKDENEGLRIENQSTYGYFFMYYEPINGLDPGNHISVFADIVQDGEGESLMSVRFLSADKRQEQFVRCDRLGGRFIKEDIEIPSYTASIELRLDNRFGTRPMILKNIGIVNGKKADRILIDGPKNISNDYIYKPLFNLRDINFTQSSPYYKQVSNGISFIATSDTQPTCIGYEYVDERLKGSIVDYSFTISDYTLLNTEYHETDANIICYDASNKELHRHTVMITNDGSYSGTIAIPKTTAFIRLRFDIRGDGNSYTITNVHIVSDKCKTYSTEFLTKNDITLSSSIDKIMYVATDGDDNNDGSMHKPKATVNSALRDGATDIRIYGGEYYQTIDLSNSDAVTIKISKHEVDREVTFIDPNRILCNSATLVSGTTKVYRANISATLNANNIWIFQDNIPDEDTLISQDERHPLQRGYEYRCGDTVIKRCSSSSTTVELAIAEIEAANEYKWYNDNGVLYFSRPSEVTINNPICYSRGVMLFSNANGKELKVTGINSKYLCFNIINTVNSEIADCKAVNIMAAGAFRYDQSVNCKLIRCEAARCFNDSTGDGFNSHCSNTGDIYSKQMTVTLIDCWSHDNNDDGYSDHERAEHTMIGGLFEYNCKGGVTPSYGAHITCYNVLSRRNYNGFNLVGEAAAEEGGKFSQMACYNCIAENNTRGGNKAGFAVSGRYNSMMLVGCKSINNGCGYYLNDESNTAKLIDCTSYNNGKVKVGVASNYTIINSEQVL